MPIRGSLAMLATQNASRVQNSQIISRAFLPLGSALELPFHWVPRVIQTGFSLLSLLLPLTWLGLFVVCCQSANYFYRRLGNSGLGFFATTYGPISEEHSWMGRGSLSVWSTWSPERKLSPLSNLPDR